MSEKTYTIELSVSGTRVTFGKRLRGIDLFNIDADPQSNIPTQNQLLIVRAAITEFGALKLSDQQGKFLPVALTVLLALDTVDIDDLIAGYNEFLAQGLEGRAAKFVSASEVKLALGYERDGIVYTSVTFGNRLTGLDRVQADRDGYALGIKRECFLIGKETVRLSSADNAAVIEGPIGIEVFEQLDNDDVLTLTKAAVKWRDSFRKSGRGVQPDVGAQHLDSGGANGVE
jgi:hypothetical protein